jgi:hypothetical protein
MKGGCCSIKLFLPTIENPYVVAMIRKNMHRYLNKDILKCCAVPFGET